MSVTKLSTCLKIIWVTRPSLRKSLSSLRNHLSRSWTRIELRIGDQVLSKRRIGSTQMEKVIKKLRRPNRLKKISSLSKSQSECPSVTLQVAQKRISAPLLPHKRTRQLNKSLSRISMYLNTKAKTKKMMESTSTRSMRTRSMNWKKVSTFSILLLHLKLSRAPKKKRRRKRCAPATTIQLRTSRWKLKSDWWTTTWTWMRQLMACKSNTRLNLRAMSLTISKTTCQNMLLLVTNRNSLKILEKQAKIENSNSSSLKNSMKDLAVSPTKISTVILILESHVIFY